MKLESNDERARHEVSTFAGEQVAQCTKDAALRFIRDLHGHCCKLFDWHPMLITTRMGGMMCKSPPYLLRCRGASIAILNGFTTLERRE